MLLGNRVRAADSGHAAPRHHHLRCFQGSSAPCTGAGGSRIPGIFGNRLFSSCSRFAGRRIALRFAAAVLGHLRVRRVDSVTTQHRSFLLASLLPAFLLVSAFAVVQAQNAGSPAARPTNWSDPATWPNRKVPVAGDKVTIAEGKEVVLDVSPPALGSLTIDGKLSFANNRDLELTTEWIMLHGELEIGTEARPHTRKATITFTNNVKDEDIGGMGGTNDRSDRGIMLMGGTLNLHGDRTNTWTKLARHGQRRQHLDTGPERRWLAGRRRDCPRVHGFRSPAGRAANHCRHQGQYDHARQEAGLHALRQDHLRRG